MQSFLIVSQNKDAAEAQITAIADRFSVNHFDRMIIGKNDDGKEKTKAKKSIGIEEVKKMHKKIFLKPLRGKVKAVIIPEAEALTVEAQNALLKVLEEPPENTLIILATRTIDPILPTIRSRASIISLDAASLSPEAIDAASNLANTLFTLDEAQALALAEKLEKEKEKLPEQLEALLLALHEQLITTQTITKIQQIASVLKALQRAHTLIKTTNANQRLTLEVTLLSITQIASRQNSQQ